MLKKQPLSNLIKNGKSFKIFIKGIMIALNISKFAWSGNIKVICKLLRCKVSYRNEDCKFSWNKQVW